MRKVIFPISQIVIVLILVLSLESEWRFRNGFNYFGFKNSGLLLLWIIRGGLISLNFIWVLKKLLHLYTNKSNSAKPFLINGSFILFLLAPALVVIVIAADDLRYATDKRFFEQNVENYNKILSLALEADCFQNVGYCVEELSIEDYPEIELQIDTFLLIQDDEYQVVIVPNELGYYPIVHINYEYPITQALSVGNYDFRCLSKLADNWFLCTGSL